MARVFIRSALPAAYTPRPAAVRDARAMIDLARSYEPSMCDLYLPSAALAAPARLDDFKQVFNKGPASYTYGNYYSNSPYDAYEEESTSAVYHNLVSSRDNRHDEWKFKFVVDWNEDDTVSWIIDTAYSMGYSEYIVPFYNFRIPGHELRCMKKEEMLQKISHPNVDPNLSVRIVEELYSRLQSRINEELVRHSSVLRYAESDPYQQPEPVHTMLDLDMDSKNRYVSDYQPNDSSLLAACDSSDDTEDHYRNSETASPECSYGSDVSKSGDEDDKRKLFKRPPGRPKGSGRKVCKRPRSVSVPEFLRNLLFDPKYCPSIIKFEDHTIGKFRFVKPDEVAKLWGKLKQNDNMTFEKFSRAMRYHYRQSVLLSVPTARLVYQFGPKGPDYRTDNPNFVKVKSELDSYELTTYS